MKGRLVFFATSALAACTLAPAPEGTPGSSLTSEVPAGYGTLTQSEISISISSRDLEIMVTPLDESVTRVTAPDTYRRLAGMAQAHRSADDSDTAIFLVSFFSSQPDVRFIPEEVQLISRGLRVRPGTITPVTPTWGQRRVQQRRTEMAVYSFAGEVDLASDLVVAYGLDQTRAWGTILPRIQAERARARARAGIGGPGDLGSRTDPS
ncbi:MAG: hypothetical protein O2958_08785 [Gemmatimonadetes bacterium]|nr:hypothetical protein [Gemmatimonadota bacterium]MDA1103748.1 hypothetical protein [Gemmatimonadota bacterium]